MRPIRQEIKETAFFSGVIVVALIAGAFASSKGCNQAAKEPTGYVTMIVKQPCTAPGVCFACKPAPRASIGSQGAKIITTQCSVGFHHNCPGMRDVLVTKERFIAYHTDGHETLGETVVDEEPLTDCTPIVD